MFEVVLVLTLLTLDKVLLTLGNVLLALETEY
jgi:hypothetical protein